MKVVLAGERLMHKLKKCQIFIFVFVYCCLLIGCSSNSGNVRPETDEMEIALSARVICIAEDCMEVSIYRIGSVDLDEEKICKVDIENCEFYITRDLPADYPILIIPENSYQEQDTEIHALKVYGFSN